MSDFIAAHLGEVCSVISLLYDNVMVQSLTKLRPSDHFYPVADLEIRLAIV